MEGKYDRGGHNSLNKKNQNIMNRLYLSPVGDHMKVKGQFQGKDGKRPQKSTLPRIKSPDVQKITKLNMTTILDKNMYNTNGSINDMRKMDRAMNHSPSNKRFKTPLSPVKKKETAYLKDLKSEANLNFSMLSDIGSYIMPNQQLQNINLTRIDTKTDQQGKDILNKTLQSKVSQQIHFEAKKKREDLTMLQFIEKLEITKKNDFCYMNRGKHPYDFYIVEFDEINQEDFITISQRGVTLRRDGITEFYTLADWKQEISVYEGVQKIGFFETYETWRNFYFWSKCTTRNRMKKASQLLQANYFKLDPILNEAITKIHDNLLQQQIIKCFDQQIDNSLEFEQFKEQQNRFRNEIMRWKMVKMDKDNEEIVQQALKDSMDAYKGKHRLNVDNQNEIKQLLVGDTSEKYMPFTINATLKFHQQKLINFLKYADGLIFNHKIEFAILSCNRLSRILNKYGRMNDTHTNKTWIICHIVISDNHVLVEPSIQLIQEYMLNTIKHTIQIIHKNYQPIKFDEKLIEEYNYEIQEEGLMSISETIYKNKFFNEAYLNLQDSLEKQFGYLREYDEKITPYLKIYTENTNRQPFNMDTIDIDFYESQINKYSHQDQELQSIERELEISIFLIKSKQFKDLIISCAADCIDQIYKELPIILQHHALLFSKEVSDINNKMNFSISENSQHYVSMFVKFIDHLEQAQKFLTTDSYRIKILDDFVKLTKNLKLKIDEKIVIQVMQSNAQLGAIQQKINLAISEFDQHLGICCEKLFLQIALIEEKIKKAVDQLQYKYYQDPENDIQEVVNKLTDLGKFIDDIKEIIKDHQFQSKKVGADIVEFPKMEYINLQYKQLCQLWISRNDYKNFIIKINPIQFLQLKYRELEDQLALMKDQLTVCQKQVDKNDVVELFKKEIFDFTSILSTLSCLLGKTLKEKDWGKIREAAQNHVKDSKNLFTDITDPKYTFHFIATSGLLNIAEKINEVQFQSIKEQEQEEIISSIENFWKEGQINSESYNDSYDDFILTNNDNIIIYIDDALIQLNGMMSNKFVANLLDRLKIQLELYKNLQIIMDLWYEHQKTYTYLDSIISIGLASMGLHQEQNAFKKAQLSWKGLMRRLRDYSYCRFWVDGETYKHYVDILNANIITFANIKKTLDENIEKKREHFHRFYFFSTQELLQLLSQASTPNDMTPYIRKVFDCISDITYNKDQTQALTIQSIEGELLPLQNCTFRNFDVEEVFNNIHDNMISNIKMCLKSSIRSIGNMDRIQWIKEQMCQVAVSSENWSFTYMLEEDYLYNQDKDPDMMYEYGDMHHLCVKSELDLEDLINVIILQTDQKASIKYQTLLTQNVHFRDLTYELYKNNVVDQNDFLWLKFLKVYHNEEGVYLQIMNISMQYGYEFLGAMTRLVVTPLTEKCHITIITALQNKLGANPAGPAGTGKTESIKDLAKILGKFCIVFNCSESNDIKILEKLFIGQVTTGCWICFDEFNRIDSEVLSVIATILESIRSALLEKKVYVEINSKSFQLNYTGGNFSTFNPDYLARSELPDNVKQYFRPIAMVIPDYQIITENLLFTQGFLKASIISKKISVIYDISSQQFSNQAHYDFGLRSLKQTILYAGYLKKKYVGVKEYQLICDAIYLMNQPKLVASDSKYFVQLIGDLFPGITPQIQTQTQLKDQIRKSFKELNLIFNQNLADKIEESYTIQKTRFGISYVGDQQTGKSTLIKILAHTMNQLNAIDPEQFQSVSQETVNPKSIAMDQLYGYVDHHNFWHDGVLSSLFRKYAQEKEKTRSYWIILDGPQDSYWIENLNSVLDDSRILCLQNGERVKMNENIRLIFETDFMNNISPATISRMAISYIGHTFLTVNETIQRYFLNYTNRPDFKNYFLKFCDTHIDSIVNFVKSLPYRYFFSIHNCMTKTMTLLTHFIQEFDNLYTGAIMESFIEKSRLKIMHYSFCQGFASHMEPLQQEQCVQYFTDLIPVDNPERLLVLKSVLSFQKRVEGQYIQFDPNAQRVRFKKGEDLDKIKVITPQINVIRSLCSILASQNQSMYLLGESGCGKSTILEQAVTHFYDLSYQKIMMSNYTRASHILEQIQSNFTQYRQNLKYVYMPASKNNFVFIIDDVNLTYKEHTGAQPTIEFLRQIKDKLGFYDQTDLIYKYIERLSMFIVSSYPGGNRKNLTPRFVRHFLTFHIDSMGQDMLNFIYEKVLQAFMNAFSFKTEISQQIPKLVLSTVQLMNKCKETFLPSHVHFHYHFSLVDISKVMQGLTLADPMVINKSTDFNHLWLHESIRVFSDRFIDVKHLYEFYEIIQEILRNNLYEQITDIDNLFYVNFLKSNVGSQKKLYEQTTNITPIQLVINKHLKEEKMQNIAIYKESINHISRISRILLLQKGHMLLVGLEGSGKSTLVKIAAMLNQVEIVKIVITPNFNKKDFRETLASQLMKAVIGELHIICYIKDMNKSESSYLEDINNFISTGETNFLFKKEDMDKIMGILITQVGKSQDIMDLFNMRIKDQFHIIWAQSPMGPQLSEKIRLYPSILNIFNLNWMQEWRDESLVQISTQYFKNDFLFDVQKLNIENLSLLCMNSHIIAQEMTKTYRSQEKKFVYFSFQNYIEFLKNLKLNIVKCKESNISKQNKLQQGLNKLLDAEQMTTELKQKLLILQPELAAENAKMKQFMNNLNQDQSQANSKKKQVEQEANEINIQQEKIMSLKQEAQVILNEAKPVLNAANEQLDKLSRGDISEIKNNNNPNAQIKFAVQCTAIFLDYKEDWDSCKKNVLSDTNLLQKMKNLNMDKISEATIDKIKARLAGNPSFVPEQVKNINVACKSLCEWIHGVINVYQIFQNISEKKKNIANLDSVLSDANQALKTKKKELTTIIEKVQSLEKQFGEAKGQKEKIDNQIKQAEDRLYRAAQLTEGLIEEQKHWKTDLAQLQELEEFVIGDSFLHISNLIYMGGFTKNYRTILSKKLQKQCQDKGIKFQNTMTFMNFLGNSNDIKDWQLNGLASDETSVENAILVTQQIRVPLIQDPQKQAINWLKNQDIIKGVVCQKWYSDSMTKSLIEAVTLGNILLIEDIQSSVPQYLSDIVKQELKIENGRRLIKIDGQLYDYKYDLQIYLFCYEYAPHFIPSTFNNFALINFSLTYEGLYDRFLQNVVHFFLPEDQRMLEELAQSSFDAKIQIQQGEKKILTMLTSSRGMILDDSELIDQLKISKEVTKAMKDKILQSESKEAGIKKSIEVFYGPCEWATKLFQIIQEIFLLNPMYQYSFKYYNNILMTQVEKNQHNERHELNEDFENNFNKTILENIAAGLFNKDKRVVVFLVAIEFAKFKHIPIDDYEFNVFQNGVQLGLDYFKPLPAFPCTQQQWSEINTLGKFVSSYKNLVSRIEANPGKVWEYLQDKKFFLKEPPVSMTLWQKMVLVRIFHKNQMLSCVDWFIEKVMGPEFINISSMDTYDLYSLMDMTSATVFINQKDQDAMSKFWEFVAEIGTPKDMVKLISLGQGQNQQAKLALMEQMEMGGWILIQNLHLGRSFIPTLEQIIESMEDDLVRSNYNENFRLFITTESCDFFPQSILKQAVKISNEPSDGIKNNMLQIYKNQIHQQQFLKSMEQEGRQQLIFAVTLMHTVLQQRFKYGPIGFSSNYNFNTSDLNNAFFQIDILLKMYTKDIPWKTIIYVLGTIVYGGKVTDVYDRSILFSVVKVFLNDNIFKKDYQFTESPQFLQMDIPEKDEQLVFIDKLPVDDPPQVYGLDPQVNLNYQDILIGNFLSRMDLSIKQDRSLSQAKIDEQNMQLMKKIEYILAKCPQDINMLNWEIDPNNRKSSYITIEVNRFNILLQNIRDLFDQLSNGIKGVYLMNDELSKMQEQMIRGEFPTILRQHCYLTIKPFASFFEDLIKRYNFFNSWIQNEEPVVFMISAFFFPQGLLGSVIQNHARLYKMSLDEVKFKYLVSSTVEKDALNKRNQRDGCVISGLYSEGFKFETLDNNKIIINKNLKGKLHHDVPLIHFIPVLVETETVSISLPIYKITTRKGELTTNGTSTNFILNIQIETEESEDYWHRAGAALFCQLPY